MVFRCFLERCFGMGFFLDLNPTFGAFALVGLYSLYCAGGFIGDIGQFFSGASTLMMLFVLGGLKTG